MKNVSILVLLLVVFASCSGKQEEQQPNTYTLRGDTIVVDDNSIIAPKLKTAVIKSSDHQLEMKTQPGTPLFEMASSDFSEVQKSLLQARSELKSARSNLQRQQDLHAHGVAALRDLSTEHTTLHCE